MSATERIQSLAAAGRTPKQTILQSMKDTGKKAIGCFPIYLPEEIIYASGLLPVGMWGGQTAMKEVDRYIQGFGCSIMRANMELGIRGTYRFLEAIVIPTYCDTMKSILANWIIAVEEPKVLPYTVLQNRQSSGSLAFILHQNEKLRGELAQLIGRPITDGDIEEAFAVYEAYRAAMRRFVALVKDYPVSLNPTDRHLVMKAAWFMDKKLYTQQLTELMDELEAQPKERSVGPKVVVTGLMTEPVKLLEAFTENGYTFVADDLAHESRQFRTLSRNEGTTMERIACRMLDLRGDTFFYEENKSKGPRLIQAVKELGADGVVVCMFKFCDPEEFDYPVYKKELEEAGVPMLYIEVDQQMDSIEQLRTRIQSFAAVFFSPVVHVVILLPLVCVHSVPWRTELPLGHPWSGDAQAGGRAGPAPPTGTPPWWG